MCRALEALLPKPASQPSEVGHRLEGGCNLASIKAEADQQLGEKPLFLRGEARELTKTLIDDPPLFHPEAELQSCHTLRSDTAQQPIGNREADSELRSPIKDPLRSAVPFEEGENLVALPAVFVDVFRSTSGQVAPSIQNLPSQCLCYSIDGDGRIYVRNVRDGGRI